MGSLVPLLLGSGMVVVVLSVCFFALICWWPATALTGASWISYSSFFVCFVCDLSVEGQSRYRLRVSSQHGVVIVVVVHCLTIHTFSFFQNSLRNYNKILQKATGKAVIDFFFFFRTKYYCRGLGDLRQ